VLPVFTQERRQPVPTVCDGVRTFKLAKRINEGDRERLVSLGVNFTGAGDYQYNEVVVPAGWQFSDTANPMVKRLSDASGTPVAQLFFRPTGGTPSVHVFLTEDEVRSAQ